MKNFDRNNRAGGSRGDKWSKRRDFGGSSKGSRPIMHQTICSECGKECEVPFRPTGDRPVFCNICFAKQGKTSPTGSGARNYQGPGFDKKQMFEAVCAKCGNKCEVPFRPTGDKPVYCSQCFDKGSRTSGQTPNQFKQQFEILNSKLDKILQALNPAVSLEVPKEGKTVKAKKEIKKSETTLEKVKAKKSAKGGK